MAMLLCLAAALGCLAGSSKAYSYNEDISSVGDYNSGGYYEQEPRFLFANFTSGLVQVNTTILTYALLAALAGGAVILVLYYLYTAQANTDSRYGYNGNYYDNNGYYDSNYQQYYR